MWVISKVEEKDKGQCARKILQGRISSGGGERYPKPVDPSMDPCVCSSAPGFMLLSVSVIVRWDWIS